jgi:hypothetical protein
MRSAYGCLFYGSTTVKCNQLPKCNQRDMKHTMSLEHLITQEQEPITQKPDLVKDGR